MENLKIFDTLSKRFIITENKNNKGRFHKEIDKDKEYILNFYRNTPVYRDKIDNMIMKSKGNFYYKNLIKNKLNKKNRFMSMILKSINSIKNKDNNSPIIGLRRYNLPKIYIIKERKRKLDLKLKAKEDEENINKNQSMENNKYSLISSYKNYLQSGSVDNNNNKTLLSNSKSVIFSGVIKDIKSLETNTSQKNDISNNNSLSTNILLTNNKSEKNFLIKKERLDKFNNILNKCQKEITTCGKIEGRFEKFTKKFNKNLSKEKKRINNEVDHNIQDQKIVEDKVSPKQKYKLLEIEKFKEIKKRINAKISDNMVYLNRKEYYEFVNDKKKIDEYNLYHDDINKECENLVQNRLKEKIKFKKVKNLLEYSYKKKNYLANKIKNYNRSRSIQKSKSYNEKNNLEIITNEVEDRGNNLGTLLPKLLSKKKENSLKNKKLFFYFD